jgi:hypothetical protein
MSKAKAYEALADVRRWLCDNLSDGDAGKVCGMLSVVSRRIAEIEEENAKLRQENQSIGMAAYELGRKSMAGENVRLRELVRRYGEFIDQDRCEGCVYKSRCNDGYVEECWQLTEIRELARELEMENGD